MGKGPLFQASGLNISTEPQFNDMVRVQLLKNTNVDYTVPNDAKDVDILTDKVEVPAEETTYWCHVHKLPEEMSEKYHILRVSERLLWHYGICI